MIHINDIVVEKDGQTTSLLPIQTNHLDEALDSLYEQITAVYRT